GQDVPSEFGRPVQANAHVAAVTDEAYSPDATCYDTGSLDKTIKSWKLSTEAPVKSLAHPNLADAVAFNPQGTLLATRCQGGKVPMSGLAQGQGGREIRAQHVAMPRAQGVAVHALPWSRDGKQLLSTSLDTTHKLWAAANGKPPRGFKASKAPDTDISEV